MSLSILILAAGPDETLTDSPVYFAEFGGKTLLELFYEKYTVVEPTDIALCCLKSDIQRFHLDRVIKLLSPKTNIIEIEKVNGGSGCTALYGACQLPQQNGLLMVSANEFVNVALGPALDDFRERQLDGGTFTFQSTNPRYSFVKTDKDGRVIEVAQKNPISTSATAGLFWYARTEYFVEAAKQMIIKNARIDGRFFIAPAFNEMILKNKHVGETQISRSDYWPLKTAAQRELFEDRTL
jgi:hypothetical protein